MRARIEQELALLRESYLEIEHKEHDGEDWFRVPRFGVPNGWQASDQAIEHSEVCWQVKADFPGAPPYGFLIPANLAFNGNAPNNSGDPPKQPPFPGPWRHLSWAVDDWSAKADVRKGSNLLAWCRSFRDRLLEGA